MTDAALRALIHEIPEAQRDASRVAAQELRAIEDRRACIEAVERRAKAFRAMAGVRI